jgi:hypothetical protein
LELQRRFTVEHQVEASTPRQNALGGPRQASQSRRAAHPLNHLTTHAPRQPIHPNLARPHSPRSEDAGGFVRLYPTRKKKGTSVFFFPSARRFVRSGLFTCYWPERRSSSQYNVSQTAGDHLLDGETVRIFQLVSGKDPCQLATRRVDRGSSLLAFGASFRRDHYSREKKKERKGCYRPSSRRLARLSFSRPDAVRMYR